MARGKYAKKAQKTRDVNELSRQIEELTQSLENERAKSQSLVDTINRQALSSEKIIGELREQNENLTNGEIENQKELTRQMKTLLDIAVEARIRTQKTYERISDAFHELLRERLGLNGLEATELMLGMMMKLDPEENRAPDGKIVLDVDDLGKFGLSAEQIDTLQKLRSQRNALNPWGR